MLSDAVSGEDVSDFSSDVRVQNLYLGNLPVNTSFIAQSSYDTLEESEVQLAFDTFNPLGNKTAILVTVPQTLPTLFRDTETCYMKLNGFTLKNVCKFSGYDITFAGGFSAY